jgi:tRNA(Arg) A34 adenosine deaminase TadA
MSSVTKYFRLARQQALKGDNHEVSRRYRLGAVGIRNDGTVVVANNIPNRLPEPEAHAEARLVKKLDWNSTVYVVRIYNDGAMALARPCRYCVSRMRLRGVRRCYYSINDTEYGVLEL